MAESISYYQIYLLMLGMTLAGSASTITQKLQNGQGFDDSSRKYQHPFFQTFLMFVGELV